MDRKQQHVLLGFLFLVQVIAMLLLVGSVAHGIVNRSDQIFWLSIRAAGICAVLTLVGIVVSALLKGRLPTVGNMFLGSIGGLLFGFSLVFSWYSVGLSLYDAYKFATSPGFSDVTSIVLVAIATLFVGIILFVIRLKWRVLYGVSEVLAGVAVASQRFYSDTMAVAGQTPKTFVILAILTAGVYLVVRGADNIHHGLTKGPLDPFGQKLIKWLDALGKKDLMVSIYFSPRKSTTQTEEQQKSK